jgi:membrane-bound lytic murein transglycosylase B
MSVARAVGMGIEIPESIGQEEKVSFAIYQPEKGKDVFLALFNNFRVITAYNFSVHYALVVSELSNRLKDKEAMPSSE